MITLTGDNIKRLSLYFFFEQYAFKALIILQ
jgi:hypothetical protein